MSTSAIDGMMREMLEAGTDCRIGIILKDGQFEIGYHKPGTGSSFSKGRTVYRALVAAYNTMRGE